MGALRVPAHALTPEAFFSWVRPFLESAVIANNKLFSAPVEVEFVIGRDQGPETWALVLSVNGIEVRQAAADRPAFIIKVHEDDARALLERDISARAALDDGRLKITGDVLRATQIAPLLLPDLPD